MKRLTDFQLYCMLILLVMPVAFLKAPKRLIIILYQNAWIAPLLAVVPGILIIFLYACLIKKSKNPFPLMFEEYLGKPLNKILCFFYIIVFILAASFSLRFFVDFMVTNVLPATPISILIALLLLAGLVSIKTGLTSMARIAEIIVPTGMLFTAIILLLAFNQNTDPENLLPFAYLEYQNLFVGILFASFVFGKMMPVLTFAYFLRKKEQAARIAIKALFTYILIISLTVVAVIMLFGVQSSIILTFPTFTAVSIIQIGDFVQNLDIVFIGIWILGIFGTVTIPWFMACYTAQYVFGLRDYRFLAAPSSVIIGVGCILISQNLWELTRLYEQVVPMVYLAFFVFIPFLLFLIALFKPDPEINARGNPAGNNPEEDCGQFSE